MNEDRLTSAPAVATWLRAHVRSGDGLSRPYGRRWENAGRVATEFLWSWPADRLSDFAEALYALRVPIFGMVNGLRIELPESAVWIGVNRSDSRSGASDAYSLRFNPDDLPTYVGNSPEVIRELVRALIVPASRADVADVSVQIGFPGATAEPTYVGSPEWDIHGEVRGAENVTLALTATAAAIDESRSSR